MTAPSAMSRARPSISTTCRSPPARSIWCPAMPRATRGRIVKLDLEAVRAADGVIAVLTAEDIPGINDCSPNEGDDPILAPGRIDFHGQVVFAVVGETRDAARRAIRHAVIEVEAEKPAVTVEDAIAAENGRPAALSVPARRCSRRPHRFAATARRILPHRRPGAFLPRRPGRAGGAPGEPAGCWSIPRPSIRPRSSICVAKMLAVPDAAVVCECRRMGGGFGGKEVPGGAMGGARRPGRAPHRPRRQDAGSTGTTT